MLRVECARMLKFNKSTMIALYAMLELAGTEGEARSASEIAECFHASKHHLVKVLQQLVRAGLVASTRGVGGGHSLARDPGEITLLEIVEVFEGAHRDGDHCLLLDSSEEAAPDPLSGVTCRLHPVFREMDEQITATLQSISLKTLVTRDISTG